MSPDELRALAEALEPMSAAPRFDGLPVVEFCAWLRQCAEEKPVAWLHDVVQDGDEPDEALSFYPDSFPLENVGGFRSIGCKPLYAAPAAPQAEPRLRECAQRLVTSAEWGLAGALNASSKSRDIPSSARSVVKARHLAALRDALSGE